MPLVREQFESQADCLICCLNYCVGLSNLSTFPFLIYDNGGVVFLLVYLALLCVVAVPMLYIEIFLGQFCGWSIPRAFGGFPMAKGLGWTMLYGELLIVLFHITPVAYCFSYVLACLGKELPWNSCEYHGVEEHGCYRVKHGMYPCSKVNETMARRYWSRNYSGDLVIVVSGGEIQEPVSVPLQEYESLRNNCINGTISAARTFYERHVAQLDYSTDGVGDPAFDMPLAMTITWVLMLLAIFLGLRSLRKASMLMLGGRLTLLTLLCVASSVLSGAKHGILMLLQPDLSKVYSAKTWSLASQHVFYSIGLSVGTVTFFASRNNFDWPVLGMSVKIALADTLFGLFAAVVVFSLYGHLADVYSLEISDVATPGLDYLFVSFPETVEPLPWPRIWALAFFVIAAIAALGPEVCTFASAVASLADMNMALSESRTQWACISCVVGFGISLPLAIKGVGITVRNFVAKIIYVDLLPWIGVAEVLTVAYAYGAGRFTNDILFVFRERPPIFLPFCWRFVCPIILMVIALTSLVTRAQKSHDSVIGFQWTNPIEMCVFGSVIVLIGAFVLHALAQNKYDLYAAMEPQPGYGPRDEEQYSKYIAFLAERNALPSIEGQLIAKLTPPRSSPAHERAKGGDAASFPSTPTAVAEPVFVFGVGLRSPELRTVREGPVFQEFTAPTTVEQSVATENLLKGATSPTIATSTGVEPATAATISEEKESNSKEHSERVDE